MPILLAGASSQVLLVAGQSNAITFGTRAANLPAHLQTVDAGIKTWNGSAFVGQVNGSNNSLLCVNTDSVENFGPEAEFSYKWRQFFARDLNIVKFGRSGTALSSSVLDYQGNPFYWDPSLSSNLFTTMETYVASALAALVNPRVIGLLWCQAEQDATDSAAASAYGSNLSTFITAARSRWKIGQAPIMLMRCSNSSAWTFRSAVRSAQDAAASSIVKVIDTDGYPLQAGGFHYTETGVVSLGGDMWNAFAT